MITIKFHSFAIVVAVVVNKLQCVYIKYIVEDSLSDDICSMFHFQLGVIVLWMGNNRQHNET